MALLPALLPLVWLAQPPAPSTPPPAPPPAPAEATPAAPPAPPPAPPPTFEARMSALASAGASVTVSSLVKSAQGADVPLIRIAAKGDLDPDSRPALLIVAGLDGRHRIGVDAALGVADRLASKTPEILNKYTLYIVPRLNPDGAAYFESKGGKNVLVDFGRRPGGTDADRDGRTDEDGPDDLNGDGVITMMRIKDPLPKTGLTANRVPDTDEPRLLRDADPAKGERAQYAVIVEGLDNDGDGRFNEDGPGGSAGGGPDFNMNFPYLWPEHKDGAGNYPLSEPGTLALTKWIFSRDNIAAVLVFGPQDTIVGVPEAGTMDPSGQVPTGIERDDKPYYDAISKAFKDATGMTDAPKADLAGSLVGWSYAVDGVWAFSTPVWVRPDQVKKPEPKPEPKKEGEEAKEPPKEGTPPTPAPRERPAEPAAPPATPDARPPQGGPPAGGPAGGPGAGGEGRRGGRGGGGGGGRGGPGGFGAGRGGPAPAEAEKKENLGDDNKWLAYSDKERAGSGFIAWSPFTHPQLGPVEIGGFVPGFRMNPPQDAVPALIDQQTAFVTDLIGKLPRLRADDPIVERVGPGVWRVTLKIANEGFLPSVPRIGVKARRTGPTLARIEVAPEAIISGEKIQRTNTLNGSGAAFVATWLVGAADGSTLKLVTRSPLTGERTIDCVLKEAAK